MPQPCSIYLLQYPPLDGRWSMVQNKFSVYCLHFLRCPFFFNFFREHFTVFIVKQTPKPFHCLDFFSSNSLGPRFVLIYNGMDSTRCVLCIRLFVCSFWSLLNFFFRYLLFMCVSVYLMRFIYSRIVDIGMVLINVNAQSLFVGGGY